MVVVVARLFADTVLVGTALFVSAGTLAWVRGWVLLATLLLVRIAGAAVVYRVNPALLRERAKLPIHDGQSWTDRMLVASVVATGFVGLPAIAGRDGFHWQLLPRPSWWLADIGLVLFILGWMLKSIALRANAFAVAVVRVQRERAQAVVDSGVYGVIRHPFYAADPLIFLGLSLWLESSMATLCAAIPSALMVLRLLVEERILERALPGYSEYAARVRYRLIPGVW